MHKGRRTEEIKGKKEQSIFNGWLSLSVVDNTHTHPHQRKGKRKGKERPYMAFSIDTTSIGEILLHISVNVTTSLNKTVTHSNT